MGLLYNLIDQGLTEPILVALDGPPGLKKDMREVYPRAIRQRCKVDKTRNILAKTTKSAQSILKTEINKVFNACDYKEALKLANTLIERYRDQRPSAIACFEENLENCLVHLKLPPAHHKATGTTWYQGDRTVFQRRIMFALVLCHFDGCQPILVRYTYDPCHCGRAT